MSYNLVQMADFLKGLDSKTLQTYLAQPPGQVPPFLVAAEAARRQDIEQKMAGSAPQSNATVLDDLIRGRAQSQGLNQMPAMAAKQGGIAGLQQQEPQGMSEGGAVSSSFMGVQYDPSKDLGGGFPGLWDGIKGAVGGAYEYMTTPWEDKGYWDEEDAKPDISDPLLDDKKAAARKEGLTAQKSAEMGAPPQPSAETQEPGSADAPDELRDRLKQMTDYERKEYLAGLSPSEWFMLSNQLLNPNQNIWQALSAGGAEVSQSIEQRMAAEKLAEREQQAALFEYDRGERNTKREREASRASATIDSMKYQGEQAMKEAEFYLRAADNLDAELADLRKAAIDMTVPPEQKTEIDKRIAEINQRKSDAATAASNALARSQYYQMQYGNVYGTYGVPETWTGTGIKKAQ